MIRVIDCLSAPALWREALGLSTGFAVLVLGAAAFLALSAPAPAAQQLGPPAPQATQPVPNPPVPPQTAPAGPTTPAEKAAPQTAPAGPTTPAEKAAPQTAPAGPTTPAEKAAPQTAPAGPTTPAEEAAPQTAPAGPTTPAEKAAPQTAPASPTTPAEKAPPAAPAAAAGGAGVGFRLENADLLQFISLVAGELKLNYIVDSAVRGAVTISTTGELKTEDLLPILETVLKMNNATAIKTGNFYRIVPLAAAPKNPLGVSTNTNGAGLPEDDRMLMQIIPLKFVFAADMAKMLAPFLSEGGTVAVHEAGNTLILVDDSLNLKRLMEILQQFDNSSFVQQRVRLIPVRNNVASALVPELEAIFSTYALSEKQTPLRFVPLDRINGILVAAADPAAFDEVEQWVLKLDQPAAPNGIQTFVYKVQNSEADRLVQLLNALRGRSGGGVGETGTGTSGGAAARGRGLATGGGGGGQEQTFQQRSGETTVGGEGTAAATARAMRIITDTVSNSVIVQSTAQEYADIARTLEKLDVLPRQVLIEARVYEVDITGDLSFGLEYALSQRTAGASAQPFNGDYGVTTPGGLTVSGGTAIGTRLLMSYLSASENRSRVKTLSAPTVLATDSTEAHIQVGASVPVLTSQGLAAGGQIAGNSLYTSTVQNVDTGIILSVTPRITSTGLVSLTISQDISNAVPAAAGSGIQSPSFTKRSITTHAVAQDGQTIALGGLISYNYSKTTSRIPLLGDIPWLGVLFGSTSYTTTETELIVLLTPRIISTLPAAQDATRELRDKLKDLRREFKKDQLLNP
jgi:general secretion pathway protein D